MPELPEVETAARDLGAQIVGRRIAAIDKLDWERMVETPTPEAFRALLPGRTVQAAGRRAKWLLLTLDAGWTLALHLRMSGSISVHGPDTPADAYTHLVLALDDGRRVLFRDIRKFGRVRLLDTAGFAALDASLGIEPLSEAFTPTALGTLLAARRTALKPLLLNQAVVAGLGNIYVDEALWRARLHPLRPARSLTPAEVAALHEAVQHVLRQSIAHNGSTLRDYRTGYGQMGDNQHYVMAYGRGKQREPCPRCGTAMERLLVAQRGTTICPACQPPPAASGEQGGRVG